MPVSQRCCAMSALSTISRSWRSGKVSSDQETSTRHPASSQLARLADYGARLPRQVTDAGRRGTDRVALLVDGEIAMAEWLTMARSGCAIPPPCAVPDGPA